LPTNAFAQERFGNSASTVRQVDVNMITLDEMVSNIPLLASNPGPFLLKMDTQGYDKHVILGGQKTIERVDIIITEVSLCPIYENAFTWREALELMSLHGFSMSAFFPINRAHDSAIIEADCVFVRNGRLNTTAP